MNIEEFAISYKSRNYPINPKLMTKVYLTDVTTSTLIWDEDRFLVEFYFVHPNIKVVPHSHPFDSIIIHNSGELDGGRGNDTTKTLLLTDKDHGRISRVLPAGTNHFFTTTMNGASFYSISSWDNYLEKDSATVKYTGAPLGPVHAKSLAKVLK